MNDGGRIVLADDRYGKAENRLVRIVRDGPGGRHEIRDLTVTTALRGDFAAAYLDGDQAKVLPTDSQKNTCYAFARTHGIPSIEGYALALARHFVDDVEPVREASVAVDEQGWERAVVGGGEHDHTWTRRGPEVHTAEVLATAQGATVWAGVKDLVLLKSTGSEFAGFLVDGYTTLAETHDRIMATSLVASWRYTGTEHDWDGVRADVRRLLVDRFARVHSLALQQTLWEMGRAALEAHPAIAEIRLAAPNKHHFLVDLAPFGLENPNEVYYAADRPYGMIEATVVRE